MTNYDELFERTEPENSVFEDKGALNPLKEPEEIVARDDQEERLARILNGIHDGDLPITLSIYGPPGTGKTVTIRRVCEAFADREPDFAVEYINLKDCRTVFSVANEILRALTGERKKSHVGRDGVFEAIWNALEEDPEWTVLILDEIDQIRFDKHFDHNNFLYQLVRGEAKQMRDINLSLFLISNELMDIDLGVDSRVRSAMGREEVFFSPYNVDELREIIGTRIDSAFRNDALSEGIFEYGIQKSANRWGDARRSLILFRQAGELANERKLDHVSKDCFDNNLTENTEIVHKIQQVPKQHLVILHAITNYADSESGDIIQPVSTKQITRAYRSVCDNFNIEPVGEREVRNLVSDLELMGLVETWIENKGHEGNRKQIQTSFDPSLVDEANPVSDG